jgi:hypothetical protein
MRMRRDGDALPGSTLAGGRDEGGEYADHDE